MSKLFRVVVAVGLIATMMASNVAAVWAATPPEPTYGTADVDGDYSEWDLSNDFFAKMYRAADPDKQVESKLYLRYDCSSGTLYALVLAEPDVTILANLPDDSFIKLGNSTKLVDGNSGDNGTPPDFAWVGRSGNIASGWEASAQLAVGSYTNLNVHTQVNDGGQQTSAVEDRAIDLMIDCTGLASLGDYVWYDVNMNGLQDAGESGLDGVTVNLYDSSHNPKGTTTTSGGGLYTFTNLEPGDYYVEFVLPNDDYSFSLQDQGSNDAVDSDADPTTGKTVVTTLLAGETDLTWDAGLHLCDIGDRVWHDQNGDGEQTDPELFTNDDVGFNGVEVYLFQDDGDGIFEPGTTGTDPDGNFLHMTTTVSGTSQTPDGYPDGIYGFDMASLSLGPGQYWVWVNESTLPTGTWDPTTQNPQLVNYQGKDDFSFDFGFVEGGGGVSGGKIGDRVWHDQDGDGLQTGGWDVEGFNGVEVYLYASDPGASCGSGSPLAMTTTASGTSQTPDGFPDGIYEFNGVSLVLTPGNTYWVCVKESTLPSPGEGMVWVCKTSNPQAVTYDGVNDDFSIDFGYEETTKPTAVTLSTFAAKPGAGSSVSPLWLGVAGLTGLVAGSLFWVKRRAG